MRSVKSKINNRKPGKESSKRRIALEGNIIGVDEVGRGPLAGKIFVCAVLLSAQQNNELKKYIGFKNIRRRLSKIQNTKYHIHARLSDSKKLSEKQRGEWFSWIKKNKIPFVVSSASSGVIDKINISRACDKAASSAVARLIKKTGLEKISLIVDAGIRIKISDKVLSFSSYPKADENVPAVALASIIAKVMRDREMVRLHNKYPGYGFDVHKGYGTKRHIGAIKRYGPSEIHRLTFIRKFTKIKE